MANFKLIEHTADIGIEAVADEREGLAEQCGRGLLFLLFGKQEAEPSLHHKISARGNSLEETFVNWLNELLFVVTDQEIMPTDINIIHFTETEISAETRSDHIDPDKHQILREIKAVTHHQTRIDHDGNSWHARVYLDL